MGIKEFLKRIWEGTETPESKRDAQIRKIVAEVENNPIYKESRQSIAAGDRDLNALAKADEQYEKDDDLNKPILAYEKILKKKPNVNCPIENGQ